MVSPGCGGEGSSDSSRSESTAPTTTPASDKKNASDQKPRKGAWGVVFGAEGEELRLILYDLSGHTLDTFDKDQGATSARCGACAKTWPPALTEGKPRAGGGASPAKVGTTKRKDGTVQLTYAGHPLYTYSRDGSGDTSGNDIESFGGEWYAIRPSGEKP